MKYIASIFIVCFIYSCGSKNEKLLKTNTKDKDSTFAINEEEIPLQFKDYLKKFKNVNLPISIKGCTSNFEKLIELNDYHYQNFIKHYIYPEDQSYIYSRVPTNGKYIATITLRATDCYLPVLTTYKPNGEIIDEKTIAIGYCGSGCGYNCEEFMQIKKDFSIYVSDTIRKYECDSLDEEIASTFEYYIIYKKGKLLSNGKIQLTEEIKRNLKK